jgi:hypothetical protein
MVKTHVKSWFEAWRDNYINDVDERLEQDKELVILQVEHCYDDVFIVEVIKPEDYKSGYFSDKKEV